MKVNLPVTGVERQLKPGQPIVSKTDLKGIVTYANQAFVDISGYSREELVGVNHNIVRHPDMPPVAFEDLWVTIKKDLPWRGVVKNRCKNGDHYWVEAYVTPIKENGRTVGYMSVRNAPSREQVDGAEALYKAVREGRAALPRTPVGGCVLGVGRLLAGVVGGLAALLLLAGGLAWQAGAGAWVLLLPLLGAALALAGGLTLRRRVVGSLEAAVRSLELLGEGNFNVPVENHARDEFRRLLTALESMRINTRAIIADVLYSAKTMEDISSWLRTEMHEAMQRTEDQSQRAGQVTSTTEAMNRAIEDISASTNETVQAALQTQELVEQGNRRMEDSRESSSRVVELVGASRETIQNLDQSIHKIGEVTVVIKEIAEQTNLLALNASIEAARAGEQGRGFSVVADEVRKLAERTALSTEDITRTVEAVQEATGMAVASMKNVADEVLHGTELIRANSASLDDILAASHKTGEMAERIAAMILHQTEATAEAAHNMEAIADLAQNNSLSIKGLEQVTVNILSRTASELRLLVKQFEKSL